MAKSKALLARAQRVIPGCSQTFSKAPDQFVQGVSPVFLVRGQGSRVWDADGHEYLDCPSALGAVILGYGDPDVTAAVQRQLADGTVFSLPHPLEVEVAERLTALVPCAEMVRFAKNGSDATSAAVRLARACTGRDLIACCGYHGWQDWYIGTTTRNRGVPGAVAALTKTFNYNDAASLARLFDEHAGRIAAVVMEPVGVVEPHPGFLQKVAALAQRHGALLVFDEIVTGFRLAIGGAQAHYGVTPDLACFGKAMANGYPISAVTGRRELMERFSEVFFSMTFGGETLSLAAALATLAKIESHAIIPQLWRQGTRLLEQYNALARTRGVGALTACMGVGPRVAMTFKDASGRDSLIVRSLFQQEMVKRGILFHMGVNVNAAHSDEDVERILQASDAAFVVLAQAVGSNHPETFLEGAPVEPIFRKFAYTATLEAARATRPR